MLTNIALLEDEICKVDDHDNKALLSLLETLLSVYTQLLWNRERCTIEIGMV